MSDNDDLEDLSPARGAAENLLVLAALALVAAAVVAIVICSIGD